MADFAHNFEDAIELLAVVAMADNDTPIICNGFKDEEYIEIVTNARRIGRNIIPVIEKFTELDLILKYAARAGVKPIVISSANEIV